MSVKITNNSPLPIAWNLNTGDTAVHAASDRLSAALKTATPNHHPNALNIIIAAAADEHSIQHISAFEVETFAPETTYISTDSEIPVDYVKQHRGAEVYVQIFFINSDTNEINEKPQFGYLDSSGMGVPYFTDGQGKRHNLLNPPWNGSLHKGLDSRIAGIKMSLSPITDTVYPSRLSNVSDDSQWRSPEYQRLLNLFERPLPAEIGLEMEVMRQDLKTRWKTIRQTIKTLEPNSPELARLYQARDKLEKIIGGQAQEITKGEPSQETLMQNWHAAYLQVNRWVADNKPINEDRIKELNIILGKDLHPYGDKNTARAFGAKFGDYRSRDVSTGGQKTLPATDIETAMSDLIDWYNNNTKANIPIDQLAAQMHQRFVSIHPFWDGNGRIARLLDIWVMRTHEFPMSASFQDTALFYGQPDNMAPETIPYSILEGIEFTIQEYEKALFPNPDTGSNTLEQSSEPTASNDENESTPVEQEPGGVTIGGNLGNDKGKTAEELGLNPQGLAPDLFPNPPPETKPQPAPPPPDAQDFNTANWGGKPQKIEFDTTERLPGRDDELEKILHPDGPAAASHTFPGGIYNPDTPEAHIPDQTSKITTKYFDKTLQTIPELATISHTQFSQLKAEDQATFIERVIEYRTIDPQYKNTSSLIEYADSRLTSTPQRQQMQSTTLKDAAHKATLNASKANTDYHHTQLKNLQQQLIAMQQHIIAIQNDNQALGQSNTAQRQLQTASPNPLSERSLSPDTAANTGNPNQSLNDFTSKVVAIPRYMVIATRNGGRAIIQNFNNSRSQMLNLPVPSNTPITRQTSSGYWRNVPSPTTIAASSLLDMAQLYLGVKNVQMLNNGKAIRIPNPQQQAPLLKPAL